MSTGTEWSSDWKASKQPRKQRKYRANAPHHHRGKLLNAALADDVQDKVGTNSLPVREGDKAKVMRGDFAGETSSVHHVDREDGTVYLEDVERETVSGSETRIAIDPSNLQLVKLNLDDPRRIAKYDVSEEDKEAIEAEQVETDEAEETGDAYEEAVEEVEGAVDDETLELDEEDAADYEDVVSGTVDEVKEAVEERDLDPEAVLEAEKAGKDRSTLTDWLQNRIEAGETDADDSTDIDYSELVSGTIDDVKEAVEEEGLDPETVLEAEENNKDRITLTEWLEARIEGDDA